MTIIGGSHVGIELVKRRNKFVDHTFFSMTFVVEDRDQACSAIKLPVRAFWGAKPQAGEVVHDDMAC
ncbi:hypothetical protein CVE34_19610 [Pseudomonas syringae pv. actinidiae]|nr:hypothetical protein B1R35_03735 [Pseudomonas syringae pv. actinidiae]AYL79153.1 hypothetical protein CN228_03610 [Pseudomonas syringae pv. actinidiae str. Shaanxi_M228]AQX63270.1 hypothetical protein B1F85_03735 [Pseudomonas syringae pv. actinidiae]AYL17970.1 hypothetical protein D9N00_28545 [Pseudomonas syringae pv. actinidiae]NAS62303.1 hypothetical protein [Pseudomonas syringae pv. actinidiae]